MIKNTDAREIAYIEFCIEMIDNNIAFQNVIPNHCDECNEEIDANDEEIECEFPHHFYENHIIICCEGFYRFIDAFNCYQYAKSN